MYRDGYSFGHMVAIGFAFALGFVLFNLALALVSLLFVFAWWVFARMKPWWLGGVLAAASIVGFFTTLYLLAGGR